jgi:hypothetical protein
MWGTQTKNDLALDITIPQGFRSMATFLVNGLCPVREVGDSNILRAYSSIGQSNGLINRRFLVQVQVGPPII